MAARETRGIRTEEHLSADADVVPNRPALSETTNTLAFPPSRDEIERFAHWLATNGIAISWTFSRETKAADKGKLDTRVPTELGAATGYLATKLQDANIILPGAASSLFLVDGDLPEIVEAALRIGGETFAFTTGRGRTNLVYRAPEGAAFHALRYKDSEERLEAVADGYLVAPLSVHPDTGELYVQTNDLVPAELSADQVAELVALAGDSVAPASSAASKTSSASPLMDRATGTDRGSRHDADYDEACRLWRLYPDTDDGFASVLRDLEAFSKSHAKGPRSRAELRKDARRARNYMRGEGSIGADIGSPETGSSVKPNGKPTLASSLVRLVDVEERPVRFAVRPYFQRGSFHVLAARKGAGKGTWLSYVAARITRGDHGPKRRVVWVSSEDSASMDLRPRLAVAGADLGHVETPEGYWLELPRDIYADGGLRDVLLDFGDVGLLVVDPLGNHITGKDSNAESDIRAAIAPLNDLADETDTVVVGIRHETEKTIRDGGGFLAGILGSSAFVQVPRVVIGIAEDDIEDDVRHVAVARGNRLPKGEAGERFRIEGVPRDGHELDIPRAVLLGESSKSLDDLVRGGQSSKSSLAREAFLEELAANDGAMDSDDLDARVSERISGLTEGTLRKIRSKMSKDGLVRSEQVRDGDEWGAPLRWRVVLTSDGMSALGIEPSDGDSHV